MLVAEQFIQSLIRKYGKHNISTDGVTWYPQACGFLNMDITCISIEKSFIERTIQYIKDRTECFDDYFPSTIGITPTTILAHLSYSI